MKSLLPAIAASLLLSAYGCETDGINPFEDPWNFILLAMVYMTLWMAYMDLTLSFPPVKRHETPRRALAVGG